MRCKVYWDVNTGEKGRGGVVELDLASAKMSRGGCTMTYADYNGTTIERLAGCDTSRLAHARPICQSIDVL